MTEYCVSTFPLSAFPLDHFLGDLATTGISMVELGKQHFEELDASTAASLQAETGLRFNSTLTTEDIAAPDGLEKQIAVLDHARELSLAAVSVSSGGREDATEAEIELIIDRLKTLTGEAEKRNLTLSFYSHGGWMAYNLTRCERIFDAISSDSFGYYYCPYHFQIAGDDPLVALERLGHRLSSVYFDCGVDPATGSADSPLWGADIDYGAVCQAVKRTGYRGEIMLIYFAQDTGTPGPTVEGVQAARTLVDELMA
ncbi:MAG: TIM barrel protein [Chloroflexota bacterium]|jgi:sugar phosphate isomerase/epimerase|nr:TIM barrel protein [Chloroflexota bacterium]